MTWTIIIPIIGIIALLVAAGLAANVKKQSEGTDRMKEIAAAIHEGARAFLFAEYKILAIIIVIVFVAVGFAIGWTTALCFLIGAFFSIIAGFCGIFTQLVGQDTGFTEYLFITVSTCHISMVLDYSFPEEVGNRSTS